MTALSPTPPAPPPASRRARLRKGTKAALLISVLVLVAGSITGVVVSLIRKSQPGFAWTTVPDASIVGQWSTSDSVVLGTDSALTAYAAATGAKLWTWNIPFEDWLCGMSQSAANGVGAVIYGLGPNQCTTLQLVELASGRALWARPATVHSAQYLGSIQGDEDLSIDGNVVATSDPEALPGTGTGTAAGIADTLASIDATTGAVYWAANSWNVDGCDLSYDDDTVVLNGIVYAVAGCYSATSLLYEALLAINATTGTADDIGTLDPGACILPDGESDTTISAFSNHLVVHCSRTLYALAAGSTKLIRLDTAGVDTSATGLDDNQSNSALANLVSYGSTLYLIAGSGAEHEDGIVALDMADGRQLWTVGFHGTTDVSLLSANSGSILAIGADDTTDSAALYSLDPADRHVTTLVGDLAGGATTDFAQRTPAASLPAGGYVVSVFGSAQVGVLKLPAGGRPPAA